MQQPSGRRWPGRSTSRSLSRQHSSSSPPTAPTTSVKVALTTRFPREVLERIAAEAERRGTTPRDVIRDLVDRDLRALEDSPVVTIRFADAHAALDAAIRNAA